MAYRSEVANDTPPEGLAEQIFNDVLHTVQSLPDDERNLFFRNFRNLIQFVEGLNYVVEGLEPVSFRDYFNKIELESSIHCQRIQSLVDDGEVEEKVANCLMANCLEFGFRDSNIRMLHEKLVIDSKPSKHGLLARLAYSVRQYLNPHYSLGYAPSSLLRERPIITSASHQLYFNLDPSANPNQFIAKLHGAAMKKECDDYFEINQLGRKDAIEVYVPNHPSEWEKLASALRVCLDNKSTRDLLAEASMPLGAPLHPGITIMPSLCWVRDIVRKFNRNNKEVGYGGGVMPREKVPKLLSGAWAMAFAMAMQELKAQTSADFSGSILNQRAASIFRQMLLVYNINPKTMMPFDVNNGELPEPFAKIKDIYGT